MRRSPLEGTAVSLIPYVEWLARAVHADAAFQDQIFRYSGGIVFRLSEGKGATE
jgi:hypothetical protein